MVLKFLIFFCTSCWSKMHRQHGDDEDVVLKEEPPSFEAWKAKKDLPRCQLIGTLRSRGTGKPNVSLFTGYLGKYGKSSRTGSGETGEMIPCEVSRCCDVIYLTISLLRPPRLDHPFVINLEDIPNRLDDQRIMQPGYSMLPAMFNSKKLAMFFTIRWQHCYWE